MKKFFSMKRSEKGQGMTEYIIIVALVAVASIAIVGFFGDSIRALFHDTGQELIGNSGTDADTSTIDTGLQGNVSKTLDDL